MGNKENAEELYELTDTAICRVIGIIEMGYEYSVNTDTIPEHLCWFMDSVQHARIKGDLCH